MIKNILGKNLEVCSLNPITGFTRNGCCKTGPEDLGQHTVCAEVTDEFLQFSKGYIVFFKLFWQNILFYSFEKEANIFSIFLLLSYINHFL